MSRIQQLFAKGEKVLISYVVAGDPDLDSTLNIMHELASHGTDLIELGIPFSDPMADGVIIQRASQRAVERGTSLQDVLHLVQRFRTQNTHTPIVLMGYLNPILHMGYQAFAQEASSSGADGVLVVDSPVEMSEKLSGCLKSYGLDMIFLIAPTTNDIRLQKIVQHASGFIYCVSLNGVTGAATLDVVTVKQQLAHIRQMTDLPLAIGFGIKTVDDVIQVAPNADAVVIGSRFVQAIENNPQEIGTLSQNFKKALASV